MSFPNGPITSLAPSIMRFLQFAQRKQMANKKAMPEPSLPGELPMSQQIAGANSLAIDPSFLPAPQPQRPLPPAMPQSVAPMPDDMGRSPSPRIAMMAGQVPQAAAEQVPSFPRPEPLDLPERTYDMPPVVTPPTIAQAPTRDIAKENNRAMQSALIPAGLGLLLGGAPAAAAGAAGAFTANKARSEQEAAVANQEYGIKRSNDLAQYGLDRQEAGDKTNRITQQMRVDQGRDVLLTQAKRSEWEAWNKEQDRLAKARNSEAIDSTKVVPSLLTHRAKTAELMSTQPEDAQRRVAGDFNEIAASLGRPDLGFSIPAKGPVFAMTPQDINRGALAGLANARTEQVPVIAGNTVAKTQAEINNLDADNKRADKALDPNKVGTDAWYRKRQIDISQGRLNAVTEKANLDKANKGIGSWEAAQKEIAVRMAQAAKLSEGKFDSIMGTTTPATEDELLAANLYRESADSLAAKFGKVRDNGKWVSVNMGPPATAPNTSQYSLPAVTLPPIPVKGQTVRAVVPTPAPSVPSANNRLKSFTKASPSPAPKPRPTPAPKKATATPKPSATPKPASKMTREEIAREIALEFAKTGKKK